MSTAKRLVLSLRGGRKHSQGSVGSNSAHNHNNNNYNNLNSYAGSTTATSSTRLISASTSPGHELDEIAVVSGTGGSSHHLSSYGGIEISDFVTNGPRYSTGESSSFLL